jgi:hypothetical protein
LRALHGPGITLLLVLFLASGLPLAVQAGGRAERENRARLAEVERLIEARRYNDAILRLTVIVKENPDLFDAAERLMNRIREAKSQYNAKFEEMVRTLFEERNITRGLELIDELDQLDPYPNPTMAKALELARFGRELVVNLKRFTEIMDAAAALLRQGRFVEADTKYLEAFALGRSEFEAADYGNIVKNSVHASLDSVLAAVAELPARLTALAAAGRLLNEAEQSTDTGRVALPLRQALGELRRIAELKDTLYQAGENFTLQEQQVRDKAGEQASAERGYDLFLFFAGQAVSGRVDRPPEGLIAVMGQAWQSYFGVAQRGLLGAAEVRWNAGIQGYRGERFAQAREELGRAAALYAASLDLLSYWAAPLPLSSLVRMERSAQDALRGKLPDFLLAQERIRAAGDLVTLIALGQAMNAPELAEGIPRERIPQARQNIAELLGRATGLVDYWRGQAEHYRALARESNLPLQPHAAQADELAATAAALQGRIAALDLRFADVALADTLQRITAALAGFGSRRDEAVRLQEGITVELPPVLDQQGNVISTPTRTEKYPGRALGIFRQLSVELAAALEQVGRQEQAAAGFPASVKEQPNIRQALSRLSEARRSLSALQQDIGPRAEAANAAALKAAQYKQEGRQRIQDAQNNIKAQPFDVARENKARENLNDAQRALDDSLALQEDAETRRDRDVTLPELAREIVVLVNARVVRQVRSMIEEGRKLYLQQKYLEAEQQLLKARARWADTQPTENPEISQWLEKVRQAILATSGREIPQSDPLYTQMTQLYNLAYRDYLDGKKLAEARRAGEALALFKRAEDFIGQILPFFKYYIDARLLSYRIEQVRDPEKFAAMLRGDFNAALNDPGLADQERLNNLDLIRLVSPNYPGLAAAIRQQRIKLGLEEAPADPRKIADSKRLYLEARAIYQRRQRDLYPAALEKLNQAILLDPNNAEAKSLKDDIQIASGGQRQPYLTSLDEQRFKEAQGQYNLGNFLIALQIVNELLKNKRNQGFGPLLELKSACEARI